MYMRNRQVLEEEKMPNKPNEWESPDQPLGVQEIADLLGYSRTTVSSWRQRKQFPQPDAVVSGGNVALWKKSSVITWANATGRNKLKVSC